MVCNLSRPCNLHVTCHQNRSKKTSKLSLIMKVFPRGINFCLSINQRFLRSIRLSRNFIQVFHLKKSYTLLHLARQVALGKVELVIILGFSLVQLGRILIIIVIIIIITSNPEAKQIQRVFLQRCTLKKTFSVNNVVG